MNTIHNIFGAIESALDAMMAFLGTAFVVLKLLVRAAVSVYAVTLLWSIVAVAKLGVVGYGIDIIVAIVLGIKWLMKAVETKKMVLGDSPKYHNNEDPLVKRVKMNEQRYAAQQQAAANAARAQQERDNMQ